MQQKPLDVPDWLASQAFAASPENLGSTRFQTDPLPSNV